MLARRFLTLKVRVHRGGILQRRVLDPASRLTQRLGANGRSDVILRGGLRLVVSSSMACVGICVNGVLNVFRHSGPLTAGGALGELDEVF